MTKWDYTREELITICEQAVVPHDEWWDRDSYGAQCGVGKLWALLKAGCTFNIESPNGDPATTDHTIWVRTFATGFSWFENAHEDYADDYLESELFYLPTPERLEVRTGTDWY